VGRPIQGHQPDQRRCLPNSAAPQSKTDGGTPRQTGAIPGGYSGRAALRRDQCYVPQQWKLFQ
jgi:hypothetical protein